MISPSFISGGGLTNKAKGSNKVAIYGYEVNVYIRPAHEIKHFTTSTQEHHNQNIGTNEDRAVYRFNNMAFTHLN